MVKLRVLRTSEAEGFTCGMGFRQLLPKQDSLIPCFHRDARKRKQTGGGDGVKTSMEAISSPPLHHRGQFKAEGARLTAFKWKPTEFLDEVVKRGESLTILVGSLGWLSLLKPLANGSG